MYKQKLQCHSGSVKKKKIINLRYDKYEGLVFFITYFVKQIILEGKEIVIYECFSFVDKKNKVKIIQNYVVCVYK